MYGGLCLQRALGVCCAGMPKKRRPKHKVSALAGIDYCSDGNEVVDCATPGVHRALSSVSRGLRVFQVLLALPRVK